MVTIIISLVVFLAGFTVARLQVIKQCPRCGEISYCVPMYSKHKFVGKMYICSNTDCYFVDKIIYR